MKKLILILALMLPVLVVQTLRADATHMTIELLAGEETFAIAQIGKITFANNLMILYDNNGKQLGSTSLERIDKIVFSDQTEAISNVTVPSVQVFPNPTQDILFVRGIEGKQTVRIFSMQGLLILSAETMNGEAQLYVGGIQNGTYLLQIGAQVVKFIKD